MRIRISVLCQPKAAMPSAAKVCWMPSILLRMLNRQRFAAKMPLLSGEAEKAKSAHQLEKRRPCSKTRLSSKKPVPNWGMWEKSLLSFLVQSLLTCGLAACTSVGEHDSAGSYPPFDLSQGSSQL